MTVHQQMQRPKVSLFEFFFLPEHKAPKFSTYSVTKYEKTIHGLSPALYEF
jgi:hypothetical protein